MGEDNSKPGGKEKRRKIEMTGNRYREGAKITPAKPHPGSFAEAKWKVSPHSWPRDRDKEDGKCGRGMECRLGDTKEGPGQGKDEVTHGNTPVRVKISQIEEAGTRERDKERTKGSKRKRGLRGLLINRGSMITSARFPRQRSFIPHLILKISRGPFVVPFQELLAARCLILEIKDLAQLTLRENLYNGIS